MPFIPHSPEDTQAMLAALNITDIATLYDEIPNNIPTADLSQIAPPLSEQQVTRLMQQREPDQRNLQCFLGAGAYQHHVPAAVWDLLSRGEFYTAYTPYQAEASQGSLQVIFEFQSMITQLTGMEVANASVYDGASALAEAALMTVRLKRGKRNTVVIPNNLHPAYQKVLHAILSQQGLVLKTIPYTNQGTIDIEQYAQHLPEAAGVIIGFPNFFGLLDDIDTLTDLAHQHQALVIAQANPTACALLKPPGQWGENGADIACGEGQPLGVPLMSGGPYFGFMCTRKSFIRQLPGRIVGKTIDNQGRCGYTLTLQAREQHIRRGKATSNICTNQGLLVVAATIYLQLVGGEGLMNIARTAANNTQKLVDALTHIQGIETVFNTPFFHECALRFTHHQVSDVLEQLKAARIQGGFNLSPHHPDLGQCLLVCATETKTDEDIQQYVQALQRIVA